MLQCTNRRDTISSFLCVFPEFTKHSFYKHTELIGVFFQNGMIITVILITWMTLRVWPAAPKWDCLRHAVPMALWESGTRPIDCCVSSNWMPLLPAFVSVVRKVTWSWVLANIFTKSATLLVSVQRVLKVLRNRFIVTTVLDYFMTSLFWLFHCSPS